MRCALVLYMFPYCCGYRREVATLSPMPYASGRFHRAQIALGREEEMLVSQFMKERFGAASAVAASLECRFGTSYAASDIVMASGADGVINAFMDAVLKPEDEVIAFAPCGQTYRAIVEDRGARLVEVPLDEETMLPDFVALECALTPRTKLVIVSTPNDASAMAYPEAVADGIAGALFRAQRAFGHSIMLLSDEAHRDMVNDGRGAKPVVACFLSQFRGCAHVRRVGFRRRGACRVCRVDAGDGRPRRCRCRHPSRTSRSQCRVRTCHGAARDGSALGRIPCLVRRSLRLVAHKVALGAGSP